MNISFSPLYQRWSINLLRACLLLFLAPLSSMADQNSANNPLTPVNTLTLQDYYIPSLKHMPDAWANQFLLRGVLPSKAFGVPQLFRFTLPIATMSPSQSVSKTGLGDLTLMDLFMSSAGGVSYGAGPILVAPTATDRLLGAGKWQAGVALAAMKPSSWGLMGALFTYQQSFAGQSDRDNVKLLTFQPVGFYNLANGAYIRSSASWSFDLENDTNYVPIGLGIGKVFKAGSSTTVNMYVEPQYSVFTKGAGVPRWQILAGVNLQF